MVKMAALPGQRLAAVAADVVEQEGDDALQLGLGESLGELLHQGQGFVLADAAFPAAARGFNKRQCFPTIHDGQHDFLQYRTV